MYLLTEASWWLCVPPALDVPDWMALFATPRAAWPLPLPPELQVDAALITTEGRLTPLAAQAGGETNDDLALWPCGRSGAT